MASCARSDQIPSRRCRSSQYSLRTLLVGTTVAAAVCGLFAWLPLGLAAAITIIAAPLVPMAALVVSLHDKRKTFLLGTLIGAIVGIAISELTLGPQLPSTFWPSVFAGECAALFGAGVGVVVSGYRRGILAMIAAVIWYVGVFAAVAIYVLSNISH